MKSASLYFSSVLFATFPMAAQAALVTYSADPKTVHLFHLDEPAGSTNAANETGGGDLVSFDGNPQTNPATTTTALLGGAGYAGFGGAANFPSGVNDLGLGYDANLDSLFQTDNLSTTDFISMSSLTSANGSFTVEAMVKLDSVTGFNREIIATDSSQASRGFQFRVNTGGNLEFNFIGTGTPAAAQVLIPTTGAHGFVANEWFHTAMAFDGATGAANFYWTRVDPVYTAANLIGTGLEGITGTVTGPLVIGNENRNVSGEGFRGFLDEIRISNTTRTASDFIFTVPEPASMSLGLFSLGMIFRRRR